QAISGAGYPGVPAMDIQGNVVPFISGEEEKMELEPQKLLGKWDGSRFVDAELASLPTALRNPVVVLDDESRPQPRRDSNVGNGMAAVVGRVRECPLL